MAGVSGHGPASCLSTRGRDALSAACYMSFMKLPTLEAIFAVLNDRGVRYLVAGGVTVNAHGYQRMTQHLDLILDLGTDNVLVALRALAELGYSAVLPVETEEFANPERRQEWNEERNVEVFSLTSDVHRETTVDLFVRNPFEFDEEYAEAMVGEVAPGLNVRFVRLRTLIAMKQKTGRARDEDDAEHLRWILEEMGEEEVE